MKNMTVGQRVAARRAELGLSTAELGKACGLSAAAIERYEAEILPLRRTIAMKLAPQLQLTLPALMGWEESLPTCAMAVSKCAQIPVLGVIRAGAPIFAEDQILRYEPADVESADGRFYLLVEGDSMIHAGIVDGCRVLFNANLTPENGCIVACLVGGENATIKRYREDADGITLCPENPNYAPIHVSRREFETGWARVLGVAEEVVHRLK